MGPPLIWLPSVPHNNPPHLLIKIFIHSRLVLDTQIKAEKKKTRQGGNRRLQTAEMRLASKEFEKGTLRLNYLDALSNGITVHFFL